MTYPGLRDNDARHTAAALLWKYRTERNMRFEIGAYYYASTYGNALLEQGVALHEQLRGARAVLQALYGRRDGD